MSDHMDWESMGITWTTGPVRKQHGPNGADRREVATAQIPEITGPLAFANHFGENVLTNWLRSSNSLRVRAQAVARTHPEATADELRMMMYNAIRGVRAAGSATAGLNMTEVIEKLRETLTNAGVDEDTITEAIENITK